MFKYCQIEENCDIFECCDHHHQPPPPGTGDCCYDTWTVDSKEVNAQLKQATARATHKTNQYNAVLEWYGVLKAWRDDWESADQKADTLCRNLELFIRHLRRVCKITKKTDTAIDILFCMIKDLFCLVDRLKERYDDLYKCINCLKDPSLASGGIRTCLDTYGTKLDAVIAQRDLVLAKIISVMEYAYDLHDGICDDYGLRNILTFWRCVLNCEGPCDPLPCPDEPPCDPHIECCELEPMMTFPIALDPYFIALKDLCEDVKIRLHDIKHEMDKANELKASLQACLNGLTTALGASAPSTRCGN
jgi:hypothetical protein